MATVGTRVSFCKTMAIAGAMVALVPASEVRALAAAEPVVLKVIDRDTGEELQIWRHHGRLFVAGQPDARYSLRVTNNTEGRVLVVMSVDGVNILTGETASYGQRGYIFMAHQTYDVNGWRKSNTEVAAFSFAPLSQSYAARTGRPGDVGVIGIAVFDEKAEVSPSAAMITQSPDRKRSSPGRPASPPLIPPALPLPPTPHPAPAILSPPAPSPATQGFSATRNIAAPAAEKLGTAHGAREYSLAGVERFERATLTPRYVHQIEYDSYANLVASSVIPPSAARPSRPHPFPSAPDSGGYVPDPPREP